MASYSLVDCTNILPSIRIEWNGASALDPLKSYVFNFDEDTCWSATLVPPEAGLPAYTDGDVEEFEDCVECNRVCYRIIDCAGGADVITSSEHIKDTVGQIIKWQDELSVERCGQVVTYLCREEPPGTPEITLMACYASCTECQTVTEPVEEEFRLIKRIVTPKYDLGICKPEMYEKTQCKYSELLYHSVVSKRYGIEFCCDEDLEKWEIKKNLIDLQLIASRYDMCNFDSGLPECEGYGIGIMRINSDACRVFRVTPTDEVLPPE